MRRAARFLIDSLPVASRIVPGRLERESTPLLPAEALREALANALVHRGSSVGGGSVNGVPYDDRLEIISSGALHFGLTPEASFREHEPTPRNPMIARNFYRRGIIETWRRGTLKIARLTQRRGFEPPAVAARQGAAVITLVPPTRVKAPGKTPNASVAILRHQPELSDAQVAATSGTSESAINRAARKLRESGRLARIGPDKAGHGQVAKTTTGTNGAAAAQRARAATASVRDARPAARSPHRGPA